MKRNAQLLVTVAVTLTIITPTIVDGADCTTSELDVLLENANADQCSEASNYDFSSGVAPTDEQTVSMCSSSACKKLFLSLAAMNPTECTIPSGDWIELVSQLITFTIGYCGFYEGVTTSSSTSLDGGGSRSSSSSASRTSSSRSSTASSSGNNSFRSSSSTSSAGTGGSTSSAASNSIDGGTTPSATGSSSNTGAIIGGIIGGIIAIVLVIWAVIWYRRRRHQRGKQTKSDDDGSDDIYVDIPTTPKVPLMHSSSKNIAVFMGTGSTITSSSNTDISNNSSNSIGSSLWNDSELARWRVNPDDIQDIERIGHGAHGVVWLVKYRNTQILASKRIQNDHIDRQYTLDFIEEIKLVSTLTHPNVVTFIGVAWTMENDLQALFEYMSNGDLRQYLINPETDREWRTNKQKLQIAIEIMQALVYVHSFNPPLVHRDLKSKNVLLSDEMVAKLTDFGVARFRSDADTMTTGVGTSRWLAPEVISGSKTYGSEADIFSFGVVLSELDTHMLPYEDARNASGQPLPNVAILQNVAMGTLKPSFRESSPDEIVALAHRCLAHRPEDRPKAPEVAYQLRTILKSL